MSWSTKDKEWLADNLVFNVTDGHAITIPDFVSRVRSLPLSKIGCLYVWLARHTPQIFDPYIESSIVAALALRSPKYLVLKKSTAVPLLKQFAFIGSVELSKRLCISPNAVRQMSKRYHIPFPRLSKIKWSSEEIKLIKNINETPKSLSKRINRSVDAISMKRRSMGIYQSTYVPSEELIDLIKNSTIPYSHLAIRFNVSISKVTRLAHKLKAYRPHYSKPLKVI